MISYKNPELIFERDTFLVGIPDDKFVSTMAEFDESLADDMRQNDIMETKSIEYASKFVTTII